jgi:thiol:disulfide interchange protein
MPVENERAGAQAASRARSALRAVWRRRDSLFWAALLLAFVTLQWPMIKGWYYQAAGAEAPASAIAWRTDFDATLAEARASNKRVLVDFSADWCPPCVAMKHDVWPDPQVARAVDAEYVPLLVDADRDTVLAARYQVSSIPTVLLLDADGRVVKRNDGFLPRSGMLRFLSEAAE